VDGLRARGRRVFGSCRCTVVARLFLFFFLFSGVGRLHAAFPLVGLGWFTRLVSVYVSAAGSLEYMLFFDLDGLALYAHCYFNSCHGLSHMSSSKVRNRHWLCFYETVMRERELRRASHPVSSSLPEHNNFPHVIQQRIN